MAQRRLLATAVGSAVVAALLISCAETARHRVLTFFFDGVPPPGSKAQEGYEAIPLRRFDGQSTALADASGRVRVEYFPHEPYRTNECGGCHDALTGGLVREPQDGLCRICHSDIVQDLRYVHGPVAVDACLFCHHYHSSPFKGLLLDEATTLCLRCHQQDDLTKGEHHAEVGLACTECHAPHGGADVYFQRRNER